MGRGRPGGNPNIKEHGFKTDREFPLTEKVSFRVDKKTKDKLKAGLLPGWTKIARVAVEEALAKAEAEEKKTERNVKSA